MAPAILTILNQLLWLEYCCVYVYECVSVFMVYEQVGKEKGNENARRKAIL